MTDLTLVSLNIGHGQTRHWRGKTVETAIEKHPVFGEVPLSETGLAGDEQKDTKNHGGPDKAVLAIPAGNYARFGVFWHWGALGENLTLPDALNETVIRLGDRLRVGGALLEVTQPRSPCWKLDELGSALTCRKGFLQRYAASGQVGFYLRVLEAAPLRAGQPVEHLPGEQPAPTIHDLFLAKHAGGRSAEQRGIIEQALAHPALSQAWRDELTRLLSQT